MVSPKSCLVLTSAETGPDFTISSSVGAGPMIRATTARESFQDRSFALLRLHRPATCQRLRIGAVALALAERPLDVVLGDECVDHIAHWRRHRHRLHDTVG